MQDNFFSMYFVQMKSQITKWTSIVKKKIMSIVLPYKTESVVDLLENNFGWCFFFFFLEREVSGNDYNSSSSLKYTYGVLHYNLRKFMQFSKTDFWLKWSFLLILKAYYLWKVLSQPTTEKYLQILIVCQLCLEWKTEIIKTLIKLCCTGKSCCSMTMWLLPFIQHFNNP